MFWPQNTPLPKTGITIEKKKHCQTHLSLRVLCYITRDQNYAVPKSDQNL